MKEGGQMAPRNYFSDEVGQLFDDLFSMDWDSILAMPVVSQLPRSLASEFPPCDLEVGEDKSLTYSFAVAGYKEEDVSISYEDEHLVLTLKGPDDVDTKKYIQRRIKRGNVKARYHIPITKYDIPKMEAKLRNGILTVHIPVREEQKPVVITIKKE